jgi:HTH-type transcriptional regulator/antitoxin HigA
VRFLTAPNTKKNEINPVNLVLDDLIDVVGENENHILASLMDLISEFIEIYEDKHVPELTEDIAVL